MPTCPYCAENVSRSDEFCPFCDADLTAARNDRGTQRPSNDIGADPAMRMVLPVGRSGWAIAAGYMGLFSLLCVPGPIALILGVIAVIDIKRNPERHGMGRAIFGIIMGTLGSIGLLLTIVNLLIN